jgi:anti-sigma regulatory factor (Ser/Thr protein kinase)
VPEHLTLRLDRSVAAPRQARDALVRFHHGLPDERVQAAELLLTELVTNAVKYGEGPVHVRLSKSGGCFRAEVVDQGGGFALRQRDSEDLQTPGGWGLHLVGKLADRWGVRPPRTQVWFEMAAAGR